MSYIDELIELRPELREFKPHIGNSLADNYVKGLSGRYYDRLSAGIEIAARAKREQLEGIMESLLDDRQNIGGGAPFSIQDVRDSELHTRTLILALWTSRAVHPSSVNGVVQIKSKKVYGNEHFLPPGSLQSARLENIPVAEPAGTSEVEPECTPVSGDTDAVIIQEYGVVHSPAAEVSVGKQTDLTGDVAALQGYILRAEEIFLHPTHRYSWNDIVTGAMVSVPGAGLRKYMAVDRNTFRGFHKIDKDGVGAGEIFRNYFVQHRDGLVSALESTRSADDLHGLLNRVSEEIREGLVNIKPSMLASYNKIRKPVDLYIEHLVAMAEELDGSRERLIPLISLPLDSQMFQHHEVFGDTELQTAGISRRSTYMEVRDEEAYRYLQGRLVSHAADISDRAQRLFFPVYFDLLWNSRYSNPGVNLFELNP
jgi:hypothetical protein